MGLPRFSDEEAGAALLNELLNDARLEAERQFYMLPCDKVPGPSYAELWASIERDALEPIWKLVADWEYLQAYESNRAAASRLHPPTKMPSRSKARFSGSSSNS